MSGTRRRTLAGFAAALAFPAPVLAGRRREAVVLLVPAAAGSAADRWARGIAPFLERAWPRQPLAVRNRPDRGGLAALAELAEAGERRVIAVLTTPLLLARAVEAGEPSPLGRVAPLGALVEEPVLLVAPTGTPPGLEALRRDVPLASPIGTPPPGTGAHLAGLRIADRLGRPVLVFPSAAAARQAAAAGHVGAAALTMPDAIGKLREGKLAGLAIASAARSPLLPELPTLRESGLDLLGATRRGFTLAPTAPADWRGWLLAGLQSLAADADLAEHGAESGQVPRFLDPEDWQRLLVRQEEELRRRWREEPWLPRRAHLNEDIVTRPREL